MAVLYLDGKRFRRIINASFRWLHHNHRELNAINVFPVPDRDTGTNMAQTLKTVECSLKNRKSDNHLPAVARDISHAAVMGARGNSGVILSQIFKGFSDAVGEKKRLDALGLVQALKVAYAKAYAALTDPREGTILTVVREATEAACVKATMEKDIAVIIATLLEEAKRSLERTTAQLPALTEAGTVDAGAKGFVYIIEGIHKLMQGEPLPETDLEHYSPVAAAAQSVRGNHFGYCVEFLIQGNSTPADGIRKELAPLGDSLIVAGDEAVFKVHVHSPHPGQILEKALAFGILTDVKVENMDEQHARSEAGAEAIKTARVNIVTDSTCDLPRTLAREYGVTVVPLKVHFRDRAYNDGVDLLPAEFYRLLRQSPSVPTTSQPSPDDFMKAYRSFSGDHREIVSIHLSEKMSGTLGSARLARQETKNENIHIVDSGSVSLGIAIMVRECARAAAAGKTSQEIIALAEYIKREMQIYFCVDTLEYLSRGGRIGKASALVGGFLNIKPILTIREGMVHAFEKGIGRARQLEQLKNVVMEAVSKNKRKKYWIGLAHADCRETMELFMSMMSGMLAEHDVTVTEIGPVVGTHAGPGTIAVCFCPQMHQ